MPRAPMVRLVGQEVSCRPNGFFFRELERQGRDPELLLEGVGLTRERICDPASRLDWESFRLMVENLGKVWSDEELRQAGRRLTVSRWVQPFGAIVRLLLSCEEAYDFTLRPETGVSAQIFTCVRNRVRSEGAGRLLVETEMAPGYEPCRPLFRVFWGSLEAIPRMLGLHEARVEMTDTAAGVGFVVRYPAKGGALAWLRRAVGRRRAVRTAAHELQQASQRLVERAEEIRQTEASFSRVFHASPSLMVISSIEGRFVDVNGSFVAASGYGRAELIGHRVSELGLWREPRARERIVEMLRGGRPVRNLEAEFRSASGETRIALLSAEPVSFLGEECIIWDAVDITERRRAAEENRRLQEQILQMRKLEGLRVMAGGIAHDFNNLLVGILGRAELLRDGLGSGPSHQQELTDEIIAASRRAAGLTDEMLAYAGKGRRAVRLLDLVALLRDAMGFVRGALPAGVKLDFGVDGEERIVLEADAGEIRQVVVNLLTNAVESYCDEEGVVEVRVGVRRPDQDYLTDSLVPLGEVLEEYAEIEIRDHGCGMTPDTLRRIFDPFYTTKVEGRGLGLAATLGILEAHRGTVKVQSEPGAGTVFRVLIPVAERRRRPGG